MTVGYRAALRKPLLATGRPHDLQHDKPELPFSNACCTYLCLQGGTEWR